MKFQIYVDVQPPANAKLKPMDDDVLVALCAHLNKEVFGIFGEFDEETGDTPVDWWRITKAEELE